MPIKKKVSKLPAKQDFAQLDAAVSKLIGQTDLLKDDAAEPASKPQLPKKKRLPAKTGAAMDIVHPAVKITRRTRLKTVIPQPQLKNNPDPEIEPKESPEPTAHSSANTVKQPANVVVEPKGDASKPLKLEPEQTAESDNAEADTPSSLHSTEPKQGPQEFVEETDENEQKTPEVGALYANNLVQQSEPKGYTPAADQKGMALFDVEEYHLELHDWSRLNNNPRVLRLLILLLLVVVAAAVYYFGIFDPIF